MPIPIDIVTRLDATSLTKVSDDVTRHFTNAGRDVSSVFSREINKGIGNIGGSGEAKNAGEKLSKEFSSAFSGGISQGLSALPGHAEGIFNKITSSAKGSSALIATSFAGAALAIGGELYKIGEQWNQLTVGIASKTGLTGAALKSITDQVKNTAKDTAAGMGDIGDIAAELHKALGLTGPALAEMSKHVADLNNRTGEHTNIVELAKVMHGFNIEGADQIKLLDTLYDTYTHTDFSVNQLLDTMKNSGAQLRGFHINLGQAMGLATTLQEGGVDPETAFGGLRLALTNISKGMEGLEQQGKKKGAHGGSPLADFLKDEKGKPLNQVLQDIVTKIGELYKANDETAANLLGKETFGKQWQAIADQIHGGKLQADDLITSVKQSGVTIEGVTKQTETWHDEFKKLTNTLSVDLEPAAKVIFGGINDWLKTDIFTIEQFSGALTRMFRSAEDQINHARGARFLPKGPSMLGPGGLPGSSNAPGQNPTIGGSAPPGSTLNLPGIAGSGTGAGGGGGAGGNALDPGFFVGGQTGVGGNAFGASGAAANLPSPADMAAIAKAQSLVGLPYVGGITDCSGYVSQVYSAMTGTQTHFSTETFNGPALGFHPLPPGVSPPPGSLSVGILHGGPNGGHMAGTLPNGVNIESGGGTTSGGPTYGGSAVGSSASEFTERWFYMPGYAEGGAVYHPDVVNQILGANGLPDVGDSSLWTLNHLDKADYRAQMATRTGKFGLGNLGLGPGNFNPGIKIDLSNISTGSGSRLNQFQQGWNNLAWGLQQSDSELPDLPGGLSGPKHWLDHLLNASMFAEGGGVGSQHGIDNDPGFFPPYLWQEGPKPGSGWIPTGPGPYPGVYSGSNMPIFEWLKQEKAREKLRGAPGFANGGATDTVPAMLTPGEHVLTVDDVKAMGGHDAVYALRNSLHNNPLANIDTQFGGDPHSHSVKGSQGIAGIHPGTPGPYIGGAAPIGGLPVGQGGFPGWWQQIIDAPGDAVPWWMFPGGDVGVPPWIRNGLGGNTARPENPPGLDHFPPGFDDGGDVNSPQNPVTGGFNMTKQLYMAIRGLVRGGVGLQGNQDMFAGSPFSSLATNAAASIKGGWKNFMDHGTPFAGGGAVQYFDGGGAPMPPPIIPPTPAPTGVDLAQSMAKGMQQGGGYGGLIGSFINMGLAAAQQPGGPLAAQGGPPGSGVPPQPTGRTPNQGGSTAGGTGSTGGGAIGAAASMIPGGAEVSQLAMRAAQFGGQAISIGVSGALETLLPNGSPLGDPQKSWVGRLAQGVSGARALGPNSAGQNTVAMPPPPPPGSPASGQGSGPPPGPAPLIGGDVNFHGDQNTQAMMRELDRTLTRQSEAHGATNKTGW